jgi:hypothetical protein
MLISYQNWFQNRRAKVKQDAKKQLNSMHLFQATLAHHSQQYLAHPQQVAPQLPYHYGPLPVVPSNSEPVSESSVAPQTSVALQNRNLMQVSMPSSEFPMQAPVITSAPNGMPFEAQAFPSTMAGSTMMLQDFNFGPSFADDFMQMPENFELYLPESNTLPVSMAPARNHAMLTPPSDNASPNTMPQLTSAYVHPCQSDEEKPKFIVDSPQDVIDISASTGHPTPADSTTTWSSVPQGSEMYDGSASVLVHSEDSPVSAESYDRRESSSMAESISNAVFDASSSESESSFKAPSQISGLAARRQKPRPANLISTAFRSASYSAGMPGSPGANANTQDQLRRIRSHGIGIANGRISKTSGPQKSPMHATFDATAITSPKFARHASNYSVSTINSSGPLTATTMPGSLAPPTPITPNEFSRFPMGQNPGFSFPNGSPGAFSHMGEDAIYLEASSPMGKLDMQQIEQYRASQIARNEASLFHTPPQSAPAFQQHFGFHPQQRMLQAPTSHTQGHVRRISLPDANHNLEHNGQFQHQPLMQPGQGMHLAEAFNTDPNAFQMIQGMSMPADCVGDMPLQFMVPQHMRMAGDSHLPVHFHNQTPEDFQNTTRSK